MEILVLNDTGLKIICKLLDTIYIPKLAKIFKLTISLLSFLIDLDVVNIKK
jgi:hypothetical protein